MTVAYQVPLSLGFPGKNTGVGCHFFLQEIFPTQGTRVSHIVGRCFTVWGRTIYNPGNHNVVIIHLEPDVLECEVKWALGSFTTNKAIGGDGIPVELFQVLKDDAVKVLHSICQQIWKTQQWPQDWKSCFHSNPNERQCQRMLKLLHNCTHLTH